MVTHYTLLTKDHKIALREQDLSQEELDMIKQTIRHYYVVLEQNYDKFLELEMQDVAKDIKEKLELVRQLRRKLDD